MSNLITIHNLETNEIFEREMTVEEIEQLEARKVAWANEEKNNADKAAEKAALLTKLGITAEEAKLLLS